MVSVRSERLEGLSLYGGFGFGLIGPAALVGGYKKGSDQVDSRSKEFGVLKFMGVDSGRIGGGFSVGECGRNRQMGACRYR